MAVKWITFHITDRCQLDCDHCLRDPGKIAKDLPLETIERVLDQAKGVYATDHVALTGGEPTLHPNFYGIVDSIAARGMTWHMVSNGRKFHKVLEQLDLNPDRRQSISAVDFSLDGATELVHDSIRGEGSYREVLSATSICAIRDIPFALQMAVHARNEHEIEAMGMLASQIGANGVSFVMLQATGTFHDEGLRLSAAEWRQVQDRIGRLTSILTIPITTPEGFAVDRPFHVCGPWRSEQLHITVDGKLNLCCQHSGIPTTKRSDIAGDMNLETLPQAHSKLLGIIHELQTDRVAQLSNGPTDAWDHFPCNSCLKAFGRPHWDDAGAAGPAAARERWNGAWSEEKQRSKVLPQTPRHRLNVLS